MLVVHAVHVERAELRAWVGREQLIITTYDY